MPLKMGGPRDVRRVPKGLVPKGLWKRKKWGRTGEKGAKKIFKGRKKEGG